MIMSIPNPPVVLFGEAANLTDIISSTTYNANRSCRVGTVRKDDQGNEFKFVKCGEATSITMTQYGAACYEDSTHQSCKEPTTARLADLAGFWQAAVTGGSYGWIQTKGKGTVVLAAQTATVAALGANLIPVNTVETLASSSAKVARQGEVVNAAALAVNTATATATALIDCRL